MPGRGALCRACVAVGFAIVKHSVSAYVWPLLPTQLTVLVCKIDPGVPHVAEQLPHGEAM